MLDAARKATSKVYYRPMEAAVRWAGLQRHEARVLRAMGNCHSPPPGAFLRWPMLRLSAERLRDAVLNGDLPVGRYGITAIGSVSYEDPSITLRHVDLRRWMSRFYPHERPTFLFDEIEQAVHPGIAIATVQALVAERVALEIQIKECNAERDALRSEVSQLERRLELASRSPVSAELGPRSESTYLNIIGGLLTLLLGQSPAGVAYSSFHTMDAVITTLLAHHGGRAGISERTLYAKLAQARRHLHASR